MRILVVGTGGVGSAFARIATRRSFFEHCALADYDQDTTEFNLNYVIKEFNARVMFFVIDTHFSAVKTDGLKFGIGLQVQM